MSSPASQRGKNSKPSTAKSATNPTSARQGTSPSTKKDVGSPGAGKAKWARTGRLGQGDSNTETPASLSSLSGVTPAKPTSSNVYTFEASTEDAGSPRIEPTAPYLYPFSPKKATQLREMIDKKSVVQRQALSELRRRQREDAIEAAKIREDPEALAQQVRWAKAGEMMMLLKDVEEDAADIHFDNSDDENGDGDVKEGMPLAKLLTPGAPGRKVVTEDNARTAGVRSPYSRINEKKYGPPVIYEVQSPKSYAEALEMAAALDEPIITQDHGVDAPDSIAGIAREKRRLEAAMPHNRPIAIRERFLLFHEHLGDPVHHAKLMEKATRDGLVTKAKLLGEDVDEPQSIFELLFGGLFRDSNDGQKRRRRVKKQKEPTRLREKLPRRMEIAQHLAVAREDGPMSPTVRAMARSPSPPNRAPLAPDFIPPKWGYNNWLKRRKSPPLNPPLRDNNLYESAKRRLEIMRLNRLYHVTLPPDMEELTRKCNLTQHDLMKLRLVFLYIEFDVLNGDYELVEIRTMASKFNWINNRIGVATFPGICQWVGVRASPFLSAVVTQLTGGIGTGRVQFEQWLRLVMAACMYTKMELLRMVFDLFDFDQSGGLDADEFGRMATLVNTPEPVFPGNFANALEGFDKNGDGLIDFDEFQAMAEEFALIMWPIFEFQERLQLTTLGNERWLELLKANARDRRVWEYQETHGGLLPPDIIKSRRRKELLWRAFKWVPGLPPLAPSRYQDATSKSNLRKYASELEDSDAEGDGESKVEDDGGSVISGLTQTSKRALSKIRSVLSFRKSSSRVSNPSPAPLPNMMEPDNEAGSNKPPSRTQSQHSMNIDAFHSARSNRSNKSRIDVIVDNALSSVEEIHEPVGVESHVVPSLDPAPTTVPLAPSTPRVRTVRISDKQGTPRASEVALEGKTVEGDKPLEKPASNPQRFQPITASDSMDEGVSAGLFAGSSYLVDEFVPSESEASTPQPVVTPFTVIESAITPIHSDKASTGETVSGKPRRKEPRQRQRRGKVATELASTAEMPSVDLPGSIVSTVDKDDDEEEPLWSRYTDGIATYYQNAKTGDTITERPLEYSTPRYEARKKNVLPGSGIYTAPSPLTAGTVPVIAADGLTGLTAEYPHSPERLAARIGSSKLLTAAMIESRPLAEVRKALAPDRKPVVGVTPMKEEDPVAVSRMHRIAGYTIGGEQFARTVSHQNFRSHVEASSLHDDHFWYQHQAKKWETFQQSQRMKRIQSAADVKLAPNKPEPVEVVE